MSGQIDVLVRAVERLRVPHPDHAQDAANNAAAIALHEYSATVAELIERDRVATEIFTCILRGVNDLDGPMGHRSEQYVAGWLGQWAKSMHAAGFKPLNPESRDITSALARVGSTT